MLLDQCDWYAYQKRKFGHTHTHRRLIHTEREHMWKWRWGSGWGSRSQGTPKIVIKYYPVTKKNIKASFPFQSSEGTTEPTLLIPQFQMSRLQKCDTSNFCYLCHPVSDTFFMASLGNSWASLIAHVVKNLDNCRVNNYLVHEWTLWFRVTWNYPGLVSVTNYSQIIAQCNCVSSALILLILFCINIRQKTTVTSTPFFFFNWNSLCLTIFCFLKDQRFSKSPENMEKTGLSALIGP